MDDIQLYLLKINFVYFLAKDLVRANRELAALVAKLQLQLAERTEDLEPDSALIGVLTAVVFVSLVIWAGRMTWMTRNPGLVFCFDR